MATRSRSRTSKRELIAPRGSKRYVRRNPHGEFKKEVSTGRSLAADRRRHAKTKVRKGPGRSRRHKFSSVISHTGTSFRHFRRTKWICVVLGGVTGWFLPRRYKRKFERATMTRIGYCQIRNDTPTDNASYRRDNLAPLKILPTKLRGSISVYQHCLATLLQCIPERRLVHKPFF